MSDGAGQRQPRTCSLRKEATQAQPEIEGRFRALVTSSSNVVYQISPDWRKMLYLRGRTSFPILTTQARAGLTTTLANDRPFVLEAIREAIDHKPMFELEHRVLRVDGGLGWTFSRAIPLLDAKAKLSSGSAGRGHDGAQTYGGSGACPRRAFGPAAPPL